MVPSLLNIMPSYVSGEQQGLEVRPSHVLFSYNSWTQNICAKSQPLDIDVLYSQMKVGQSIFASKFNIDANPSIINLMLCTACLSHAAGRVYWWEVG